MTAEICVSLFIGRMNSNFSIGWIPLRPLRRTLIPRPGQRRKVAAFLLRRQQLLDAGVAIGHRRLVLEEAAGVGGRAVGRVERAAGGTGVDRELGAVVRGGGQAPQNDPRLRPRDVEER